MTNTKNKEKKVYAMLRVLIPTRERLREFAKKSETYDMGINRALDEAEKYEKRQR